MPSIRRPRVLLREAFLAFDADESQSVAILTGRGGTFCAGYDLKVAAGRTDAGTARSRRRRARWGRRAICSPSR